MAETARRKSILFHSIVYWLGTALSKLASFLLIPVFTHYLAPADYGTLELLTTTTGVLALLVGGRLTTAVFRFYHIAEGDAARRSVISTSILLGLGLVAVCGALLFISAPQISQLIFRTPDNAHLLQIVFTATLLGIVQELALAYIRIQERSLLFASINLGRVLLVLGLNVLFIAYFGMGLLGALLGPLIVAVALTPILVGTVLWKCGLHFDPRLWPRIVRFSAPLVPAALAVFVIHFSDRYIIREFATLEQVGIYAVAYKFGMLISGLIGQPFGLIWSNRLHTYYWDRNRDALYNRTLSGLSFILCGVAAGLSLFIDEMLMLMTPSTYWDAAPLVPVIAAGYVLFVLHSISCAPLQCEARTGKLAAIAIAVAFLSVGLNLALVPMLGLMGAAITTVLSFGVMLLWSRLAALRCSSLKLEHDRAWKPMLAATVLVVAGRGLMMEDLWVSLLFKSALLALYPALLLAMGFLRPQEWQFLRERAEGLLLRTKGAN